MNPVLHFAGRRGRILVVDDQAANIHLLHLILGQEYELQAATSGEQALALCHRSRPDLVLLDVGMPGMSGLEVCRRLKLQAETQTISVIFVTAGTLADEENACWEAGGADFVHKPVNPLTLRNRVHAHLQFKLGADALRAMAFSDGLTGIANRRHLNEQFELEWRRCGRSRLSLAWLMIDVDHFKLFNDSYGHEAGDICLQRIAGAMAAEMRRPADLVARYGGEEFACLLPETDDLGAMQLAGRIEAAVRTLAIPHRQSTAAQLVTVSIGVATTQPEIDGDSQALVRRADAALYSAKLSGRGRACVAPAG